MTRKKYSLTDEHRARLPEWRNKWISNAMSTAAMTDEDKEITRQSILGIYASAKLPPPKAIVFVPSPFVLRFAGGAAAWCWYQHHERRNDATRAATDDATRAATDDATYDATDSATYDATRAATDAATRDATDDATDSATRAATRAATYDATRAATRAATDDATDDATYDATRAATDAATRDATYAATRAATRAATDDATYDATYDATDAADLGRWFVCEDPRLSREENQCASKAWRMWQGSNQWSAFDSLLSFFDRVVGLDLPEYNHWRHWEQASLHSGPRIMHADFCMVSDRPELLLVDEQNRPHCSDGPFCRWRDGSALYSVHGVRVPAWIIEMPETITPQKIDDERNAEIRRVMVDKYGPSRYLLDSGAVEVTRDEFGIVYRKEITDDEPLVMVKVINSTPEPDGSRKNYFLRVDPELRPLHLDGTRGDPQEMTGRNAVASTFGRSGVEYAPKVET